MARNWMYAPEVPPWLNPPRDDDWVPPWACPTTGKWMFTFAPDFSGFNPDTGKLWSPTEVVTYLGLKQMGDDEVRSACIKVVSENQDKAATYKSGKTNIIGFFIKLVMAETQNQASPQNASKILAELLSA